MKYLMIAAAVLMCTGCMLVSESYAPDTSGAGYEFNGSCVGYHWPECKARAEALCAEVGQKVVSIEESGGPQNKAKMAIVPKRIHIQCQE